MNRTKRDYCKRNSHPLPWRYVYWTSHGYHSPLSGLHYRVMAGVCAECGKVLYSDAGGSALSARVARMFIQFRADRRGKK